MPRARERPNGMRHDRAHADALVDLVGERPRDGARRHERIDGRERHLSGRLLFLLGRDRLQRSFLNESVRAISPIASSPSNEVDDDRSRCSCRR